MQRDGTGSAWYMLESNPDASGFVRCTRQTPSAMPPFLPELAGGLCDVILRLVLATSYRDRMTIHGVSATLGPRHA